MSTDSDTGRPLDDSVNMEEYLPPHLTYCLEEAVGIEKPAVEQVSTNECISSLSFSRSVYLVSSFFLFFFLAETGETVATRRVFGGLPSHAYKQIIDDHSVQGRCSHQFEFGQSQYIQQKFLLWTAI